MKQKRDGQAWLDRPVCFTGISAKARNAGSVSYTHLDVYKRQVPGGAGVSAAGHRHHRGAKARGEEDGTK